MGPWLAAQKYNPDIIRIQVATETITANVATYALEYLKSVELRQGSRNQGTRRAEAPHKF